MLHYFDHAATTPVCPEAAQAALEAMTQGFGNPSSGYPLGKAAAQRREADRAVIARALGCLPEELFFTPAAPRGTTGPSPPPCSTISAMAATSSPPPSSIPLFWSL